MGIPVLIIGKSGSGKSYSLRNFPKDNLGVINVSRKPFPFKAKFKSFPTDNYEAVDKAIKTAKVPSIAIDDAGYLITNMFMRGHSSLGAGNAIFQFYNQIADKFWHLIEETKSLQEDKIIYFLMHETSDEFGNTKPKTIGKLLDEKVCIEGMFTIVLRSCFEQEKGYFFKTQTDGFDVCKSPPEMFSGNQVDNDLFEIDKNIRKFYEI